mmetsp:Transcript_27665/g.69335  ORF Transcript_27665/g.69335 Transcript_27665/m.69335 type:complete len:80 (-) Transcript_27665:501-740(-)
MAASRRRAPRRSHHPRFWFRTTAGAHPEERPWPHEEVASLSVAEVVEHVQVALPHEAGISRPVKDPHTPALFHLAAAWR